MRYSVTEARLSEVIDEVQPGFACGEEDPEGIFQIRMNNILRDGTLDLSKKRRVPARKRPIKGALLRPGDVLFNATNSPDLVGKTALIRYVPEPTVFSNHFLRLRANQELLHSAYLARWLSSEFNRGTFKGLARQWVNQATVGRDALLSLIIPLPTVVEQDRITAALDQAEELQAKRRRAISLLDDLTQSVFLDMFDSHYAEATISLGDHLTFITSGGRGWATYYSDTGSRFIRSLDVRMNEISHKDAVHVSAPGNAEAKRTKVQAGDVLLTITGSLIGRVAPVFSDLEGSYISQHVAILRPYTATLDPVFLAFFLSLSDGGQRQINQLQYGQTKPGLNFEQIRAMKIPLPPIELQRLFCERLRVIKGLAASHRKQLTTLDALFASLQAKAFRNEL